MIFYKMNPTYRQLVVIKFDTTATHSSSIMKKLRHTQSYLAKTMTDVREAWDRRWHTLNTLPFYFGAEVRSCLDTFPVRVNRPKDSLLQTLLYNGKYGKHEIT